MNRWLASLVILIVLALAGCGGAPETSAPAPAPAGPEPAPVEEARRASAHLESRSGSAVIGHATFTALEGLVTLSLEVQGAPPGTLAFHLHEIGDCSAPDASSAGGHWNPAGHAHGKWGEGEYHLGDVGNITVGEDGRGSLTTTTDIWSVGTAADNDVVGRSIVLHEKADDFTTQPTGAAGARIGCGVIRSEPSN